MIFSSTIVRSLTAATFAAVAIHGAFSLAVKRDTVDVSNGILNIQVHDLNGPVASPDECTTLFSTIPTGTFTAPPLFNHNITQHTCQIQFINVLNDTTITISNDALLHGLQSGLSSVKDVVSGEAQLLWGASEFPSAGLTVLLGPTGYLTAE